MTSTIDFFSWVAGLEASPEGRVSAHWSHRTLWRRVARLALDFTAQVDVACYGQSVAGEPLWRVRVAHPEAAGPPVLVVANLHAMEHVGVVTAVSLIERAAAGGTAWPSRPLIVVPVANPDGFRAAERALAQGHRWLVRKNARGVDLNRNFAVGWNSKNFWTRLISHFFAPGRGPLSEPETAALDALVGAEKPGIVVSLHAFGNIVFTPWAGKRERPADHLRLTEIARELVARMPDKTYKVDQLGRHYPFFSARGAELDHFYERHGALTFLIEIGAGPKLGEPGGWGRAYHWFTPREERLLSDVRNVLPALDYLAEVEP